MSVMLRTRTQSYDLGPVVEFLKFEQELARIIVRNQERYGWPLKAFSSLMSIVDLNEEPVTAAELRTLSSDAEKVLTLSRRELSDHAIWVLETISELYPKGRRT